MNHVTSQTCGQRGYDLVFYKAGPRKLVGNYRGITVLSIFAQLFEILVYNRLTYLNEAFDKVDEFNGGFLMGSRTADNMFILNGLIQRQLAIGKPLYVCFVDFSKAFDLVNRYILFYKLIKSGWSGRVIDTVRNFYSKTYFRVKHKGLVSPPIPNYIGVNQGGNASGLMFRKYMADLSEYISNAVGVCIGDVVIAHLLWADDLILFSDSEKGLQTQLDVLFKFCSNNMMIVNEMKTKVMVYGSTSRNITVKFNVKSVKKCNEDIFGENSQYLCSKARQAIFALFKRLKHIGILPAHIMMYLFELLVKPVLVYGSEIWGTNVNATKSIDKVFSGMHVRYWEWNRTQAILLY